MNLQLSWPVLVVLVASCVATATDLKCFKIYNVLTLPLIASGLLYHVALSHTAGLATSLAGAALGGGALLLFYLAGGMGAGDVKLMAGVGAWLGFHAVFYVLIISSFAAAAFSLVSLAMHGGFRRTINNIKVMYYRLRAIGVHLGPEERVESLVASGQRHRLIPYGAMIAVAIIAWILVEKIIE